MGNEPILISIPHGGWKVAPEIEAVWGLAVESMGEAIAVAGVREVAAIGLSVHG